MAIMLRSIAKAPLIPIVIFPAFLYLDGSKFSRLIIIVNWMGIIEARIRGWRRQGDGSG
jgi:hypothetical protein